jgi:hypothetical protein
MKKALVIMAAVFIIFVVLGTMSCAPGDVSSQLQYYHGQKIPDEFFRVTEWAPDHIAFTIWVDFKDNPMYHLLLDENGKPMAEGWFKTVRIGSSYSLLMKPKPGMAFEAGKKYRLCIGNNSPEVVFHFSGNYRCESEYEFVLK